MSQPHVSTIPVDETLHAFLVRRRAAVRSFIGRRVASAAEADDLTQEVFARVLGRARSGPIDNVDGNLFQGRVVRRRLTLGWGAFREVGTRSRIR